MEIRSIESFDNYDDYLEWKKNPDNIVKELCDHVYSFRHSWVTQKYEPVRCGKCKEYHPDFDENFPPIDFTGIL